MKTLLFMTISAVSYFLNPSTLPSHVETKGYCNQKYSFCLNYPLNWFDTVKDNPTADGIQLINKEEQYEVSAFGMKRERDLKMEDWFAIDVLQAYSTASDFVIYDQRISATKYETRYSMNGFWYKKTCTFHKSKMVYLILKVPLEHPELIDLLEQQVFFSVK